MNIDRVKYFLLSINGGSGVLFQPTDEKFSYILTAAHIFDDIVSYNNLVNISYFSSETQSSEILNPFILEPNINYFKHRNQDISILKISKINPQSELVLLNDLENNKKNLSLYGFPAVRSKEPNLLDRLREDMGLTLSVEKSDNRREARLDDNSNWDELVGQSGGGIFTIKNNYVGLLGIQNKVPTEAESKGRIIFTPIENFNDIVADSNEALEMLIPNYLTSFSFLKDEVFNVKPGILSRNVVESITKVLRQKAEEISQSGCTPISVREYLHDNLILLYGQDTDMIYSKKLWSVWLELFTILNIAMAKRHSPADFNDLFSKIRLFYCDTNDDFWVSNLHNLPFTNFENLEHNGLVVVSTNNPAKDNMHILQLDQIPGDITRLKKEYDIGQLTKEQFDNIPHVDSAENFPLSKYRFINMSAFKENCMVDKYDQFNPDEIPSIIIKLRELYEQAISH